MLDLLIEGDHRKCRKFWAEKMPQMPQPKTDEEAEIVMHQTRTMSAIPTNLRLWSHRWLVERELPSMLPEELVSKAMGLKVIEARTIGISVGAMRKSDVEAATYIRKKMEERAADIMSSAVIPSSEKIRKDLNEVFNIESEKL